MNELFNNITKLINGDGEEIAKENANMNSDTPAGLMMKFASETSKLYTKQNLLSEKTLKFMNDNIMYPHDLDYYPTKSLTCLQHPLDKVFAEGTRAGHCAIRPSKRIETTSAIATVMLQGVQNEMHGGQAIPAFDFYMAPYVKLTFEEEIDKLVSMYEHDFYEAMGTAEVPFKDAINKYLENHPITEYVIRDVDHEFTDIAIVQMAMNNTVKRTHQAMESFIHNMNTMHSRGGNQVVFSSINYGTDTSPEGRLVMRELLNSTYEGVGNGETPIFPIQIFKLKNGVNKHEEEPNYDLFKLACKVTARRFYPNFLNLDSSFNKDEKWNAEDPKRYMHEVATMGCRTRVYEDIFGESTSVGRGNLSFTSINLPGLAFKALEEQPDMSTEKYPALETFMELLDEALDATAEQLYERYQFQCTATKKNFPMLMSGMWTGSEELDENDQVGDLLKHGTLGVGFIGLAEALILLTGKHHGESETAQEIGLSIIKHMNDKVQEYKKKYQLNYSVLATPAEGLSGKFTQKDREKYGVVKNVTDKDYYTNSNHVPVWYNCTAKHKAEIEGPYHKYTLGGHIFYVELDGDATHNPKAIMELVRLMDENNIGYMALNHTRNRCLNCGYEDAEKNLKVCPECGEEAIDTIQRITGNPTRKPAN